MHSIRATWINGQIVLGEPVDWPEGSELLVEPITSNREKVGLTEDEWRDDPQAVDAWIAAVEKIEPLIWTDDDQREYELYRAKHREFNLEAVRRQMAIMGNGDLP